MKVVETDRLALQWLSLDDAPFILELLNEPSRYSSARIGFRFERMTALAPGEQEVKLFGCRL